MSLKPIKSLPTWEKLKSTTTSFAQCNSICWDQYRELPIDKNVTYGYMSGASANNLVNLSNDSHMSATPSSTSSISNINSEWAGSPAQFHSLGTPGGNPITSVYGDTSTVITSRNFVRDLSGCKIRFVKGDNSGHEATIVSNTQGPNSTITFDPPTPVQSNFSYIELYTGSIWHQVTHSTVTCSPNFYVYDIATNAWATKTSPQFTSRVVTHMHLTTLPYIDHVYDTATISSVANNLIPFGEDLQGWYFEPSLTVEKKYYGIADPQGTFNATRLTWNSGVKGFVWWTPNTVSGIFKPNTQYTISCWVRSDVGTPTFNFSGYNSNVNITGGTVTPTTTWTRYSYTFTSPSVVFQSYCQIGLTMDQTVSSMLIWGFQLEEGSSAGTYLPSTFNDITGSTNTLLYSSDMSTNWSPYLCTKTSAQIDPFGGANAVLVTVTSSGGGSAIQNSSAAINPVNRSLTLSFWAKAGTSSQCWPTVQQIGPSYVQFGTGNISLTSTWARYTITGTITATDTAVSVILRPYGSTPTLGDSVYFAFPQLEYGTVATDYVPTTNAIGTKRQLTGSAVSQITCAGKNWAPGSLVNQRIRYNTPSYSNIILNSDSFAQSSWSLKGTATKSGNDLLCPAFSDRVDGGTGIFIKNQTDITWTVWASGTGTFTIYLWNQKPGYANQTQFTLSASMQAFTVTANVQNGFIIGGFGRFDPDTATSITFGGAQLEFGSSYSGKIQSNSNIGIAGGVITSRILENTNDTITFAIDNNFEIPTNGTVVSIEPDGDKILSLGNIDRQMYSYSIKNNTWAGFGILPNRVRNSIVGSEFSNEFITGVSEWSNPTPVAARENSKQYYYGDKIYPLGSGKDIDIRGSVWECTTEGISAASEPGAVNWRSQPVAYTQSDGSVVWTRRHPEQNSRHIYSFRGATSGILEVFDIATLSWHVCDIASNWKYVQPSHAWSNGTSFASWNKYIYISIPSATGGYNQSRFYRFDVVKNIMEPYAMFNYYGHNYAPNTGQRIWIERAKIGNETIDYLHHCSMNYTSVFRTREIK